MIAYTPPLWICCVRFEPSSPDKLNLGYLGHVSCCVRNSLHLRRMFVRLLRDSRLTIKFPRRGQGAVLDDQERDEIYKLILFHPTFREGMESIGFTPVWGPP